MGYVIISVLAFVLGISVALACIHLKRIKDMEKDDR